jgi:superfamily II DNA helicase RecQ
MALTATATPDIIRDVCEILEMHSPVHFKSSWDRPNLLYEVVEKPASLEDVVAHIHSFIASEYPRGAGIGQSNLK